jgi:hypothetical protein
MTCSVIFIILYLTAYFFLRFYGYYRCVTQSNGQVVMWSKFYNRETSIFDKYVSIVFDPLTDAEIFIRMKAGGR